MTDSSDESITDIDPSTVSGRSIDIEALRGALTDEDPLVRAHAARVAGALATIDPERVVPLITTFRTALTGQRVAVLTGVLSACRPLAREVPGELRPAIPALLDLLAHSVPAVQAAAALVVRVLGAHNPRWFTPYVARLVEIYERDPEDPTALGEKSVNVLTPSSVLNERTNDQLSQVADDELSRQLLVRDTVGNLLYELGDQDITLLTAHAARFVRVVSASPGVLPPASAAIIERLALADPESVSGALAPLCEHLDGNPNPPVRIVSALGYLDDDRAIEVLREVAADDRVEESIRALAGDTADWIARDG